MKSVALIAGLLASSATAHMQMAKPYPIRSPLNDKAKGQKDYSYTNPLQPSGQDYPCKGYANDPFESQATYQPGQEYEMELEGSATHDGGSCQLALTYDKGKTFKVIESMLGDCPIPKKYSFTVPSDAPSGEALLAWTWFNKIGNREMYMNCAMVTVGGSSNANETEAEPPVHQKHQKPEDKKTKTEAEPPAHQKHQKPEDKKTNKHTTQMQNKEHAHEAHPPMEHAKHEHKQRDMTDKAKSMAFDSLPPLFVANVNQEGKCQTIEGEAVNFPEPGDNVLGQAEGKGYKCSEDAPFLGSGESSRAADSSDSCGEHKNATRSNKHEEDMGRIASTFGTPSADSRVASIEASTNNQFKDYVSGWSCTDGEILCSPDGWTWAMCSNGRPVFMGPVAAGTLCRFGQMVAAHW